MRSILIVLNSVVTIFSRTKAMFTIYTEIFSFVNTQLDQLGQDANSVRRLNKLTSYEIRGRVTCEVNFYDFREDLPIL